MNAPAVAALLLLSTGLPSAGKALPRYVEGSVIVTFKPWRDADTARQALDRHSLKFAKRFGVLSELRLKQTGVVHSDTQSTAELIEILKADAAVESVEPDYLRYVNAIPNDASFPNLWALRNTGQAVDGVTGTAGADMKFLAARALVRAPSTAPVVGVMDTGIDHSHPDLLANMWVNTGEIPGNGVDDDGDGKIDDVYGYNFADGNSDTSDSGEHGTHVCGTIAATGNNQIGVIGTNDQARLMMLRVSSNGNSISSSGEIAALQYAVTMKTRAVNPVNLVALNASFGGPSFSSTERDAIQAAGNAGIILCAAAGNAAANNDTTLTYPASYRLSNMIVVAASDQNDAIAGFSNYGATTVDLAAPGVNILSAMPGTTTTTLKIGSTTYATGVLAFSGPSPTNAGTTGALVYCGIGDVGQFPGGVNGNIALIDRGTINFSLKVANAMAAGATAVVIANNTSGTFNGTLGADSSWIPACSISQGDGTMLKASLPLTATVTAIHSQDFQYLDGTSMATPQVTAAVSLAAMCFPEDTVVQRVQRVLAAVDTKASFSGKTITGGRLNLQKLLDNDLNGLPDWWEKLYFNQYTGILPNADADQDGMTNLNEFLGGTIPNNAQSSLKALSSLRNPASGNETITWTSVPGKTYQVYYSQTLQPGSWLATLPQSSVTAGIGQTTLSYIDTTASAAPKRFYRVQLVP